MNYDFNYARVRKSANDLIIKQLKTGDVVKVKSELFPLIYHFGIVCRDENDFYIFHNDPFKWNGSGGNIIREDFNTWIKGKDIVEVTETDLNLQDINLVIKELKSYKYDVFKFNCEHFIAKLRNKKPTSPQLIGFGLIVGAIITAIVIIRKK